MSLTAAELIPIAVCGGIAALIIVPCILCCFIDVSTPYYERSCQPTDACPKPHEVEEARSTSIIGACGCHPWVALKEEAFPLIRAAAAEYRFASRYTLCPGPNSNTFVAHLLRSARLGIAMPPMCIGKDYIYGCGFVQRPPSGAGVHSATRAVGCSA